MAYDLELAERIRTVLAGQAIVEKKMFGGIGFMLNGNMVCGIHKNDLMLHVAAADTATLLKRPGAKPFEMRDKPMQGWVLVDPAVLKTSAKLTAWINVALTYAQTLPAKAAKPTKRVATKISKRVTQ